MPSSDSIQVDALIFGGGAAGLWTLDELMRRGYVAILLEAHALGCGQTIASQGIIHGGLKYTLSGLLTGAAGAIRDMPAIWRECLTGRRQPDLSRTRVRSEHCFLWRTKSLTSRVGMIGARVGLRVAPVPVAASERPAVLAACPGTVAQLDEQVIDPASFLSDLTEQHRSRILQIDARDGLAIQPETWGFDVELTNGAHRVSVAADRVIFTAGEGNAALRQMLDLAPGAMQRRPLHMVMLRGANLPVLFGHCVDGAETRVTITTATDSAGRNVWCVGGQLAEDGVAMEPGNLIAHARRELAQVLCGFDVRSAEWTTYRVDRAEATTRTGGRPDDVSFIEEMEGSVITGWPTKLALAPRLAGLIAQSFHYPPRGLDAPDEALRHWPRPAVALPPWETESQWFTAR